MWHVLRTLLVAVVIAHARRADQRIERLPTVIWPVQYNLTVFTDSQGRNFSGNVTIELEIREETDNITLHARGLTLGAFRLVQEENEAMALSHREVVKSDIVTIYLRSKLLPGVRYILHASFSGHLNTARQKGYYRLTTGENQWMSGTVFEYDHAREAFPCFDEPQFKARFQVNLIHHSNHTALSNMPKVSSNPYELEEGFVVDHFDNSPVMSSYLVAYHLLQLDKRETRTDDDRPLTVWAPTKQLRWTNNTLNIAPRALTFLHEYTGIPDPIPKIDLVSIPRFQGALENWGVISFMPSGVLYKPNREEMLHQVYNTKIVTHELSHTWFGNLVSPRWWDSLWLSEGAATFFSSLAMNKMQPDWDQLTADTEDYLTTTFYANALDTGKSINHPVELAKDLNSVSYAPYYKGFSLFRMLYYTLGADEFQKGIRYYLKSLKYKTATPAQLYEAFNYTYEGKDLSTLMDAWTYRDGLPIVFANRSNGQLTLSQERFTFNFSENKLLGRKEKAEENHKWWIPVSFATQSDENLQDTKPKLWLNEDIALTDPAKPNDWLLLNTQAAGTYHVLYDQANLQLLKETLTNGSLDEVPVLNRMQLVLDYGIFALAGLIPPTEVLELLSYLEKEQHYAPWSVGIRIFWRMEQRLRGTEAADKLKDQMRSLILHEFKRLGMRTRKRDTVPIIRQRKQIIAQACLYELTDCVVRAGKLFQMWSEQPQPDKVNPIPPDLRFTVYCTAMRFTGERHWNFLQERALRTRDPVNRDNMFTALGCSNQYHLLYNFMENKVENSTVTKHDFTKLLQGLVQYNNDIGPVLEFMEDSMVKMKSSLKKKLRWNQKMLRDLAHQIVEPDQMKRLTNMMSSTKAWTKDEVVTVQRIVEHNSLWRDKNKNLF